MRKKIRKLLITGGAGFIGSELTRQAVEKKYKVVVIDKLTYAGDLERLGAIKNRFTFYHADISDVKKLGSIFRKERPDAVIHCAAETHVDRSILSAVNFIETNIKGTQSLLDISRKYDIKKFLHISTDEVYGEIRRGTFSEESPLRPNSPYAASKAAADCFVLSHIRTYNFPALIARPSNNYGPWQYPEKFMPVAIFKALNNDKIPVYGKGKNKREWLHVSDCARALLFVLEKGKAREIYNIGSAQERENLLIARSVLKALKKPLSRIEFVRDRPGHDFRYALNCEKISRLGWKPKKNLKDEIKNTIFWYEKHLYWLQKKAAKLQPYWKEVYVKK